MNLIGKYMNGNVLTKIFSDGTLIRCTEDNEFKPAFASNIDIKICNRCDMGCPMCHEGSTIDGKLGDIMNEKFVDTLHPYQEVAIGGGNVLEHPDLVQFLEKLKSRNVIANITIHQKHFEENIDLVERLVDGGLVYGLGVSLNSANEHFINNIKQFPNAVIHVINGIFSADDLNALENRGLKLLILGYKQLRRGDKYLRDNTIDVIDKQEWLSKMIPSLFNKFDVVSFDNLAIDQLNVGKHLTKGQWDLFYAGDDGSFTFYIDMVERKFAKSSTESLGSRFDLLESVDEMFAQIHNV